MMIWHVSLPARNVVIEMLNYGLQNHMLSAWSAFDRHRGKSNLNCGLEEIRSAKGRVFLDSGALSALRKHPPALDWLERQAEIASYAKDIGADLVAHLDVPVERKGLANAKLSRNEALAISIRNARAFMDLDVGRARKVYVLQGWTIGEYENCLDEFAELGIPDDGNALGLGTCCMRKETRGLWQIAERVRELTRGHWLHAFGVGDVSKIPRLAFLGYDSVDEGNTVRAIIYRKSSVLDKLLETYKRFDA